MFIPTDECRIDKIISKMTLEQKIGQMIMLAFRTWTEDGKSVNVTELNEDIRNALSEYGLGGVILFAENCEGTEQTTRLIADMQETAENGLAGMKMLIGVDQEGGSITRLTTGTKTCGNMALGALDSAEDTKEISQIISSELNAEGFNVDFAPDMDVNNNPSNPVIGIRSFSSSPKITADMGSAYIEGLHSNNIAAAAKHFPGHGDTSTDSHTGFPTIKKTYDELKSLELIPFQAAVDAGTDIMMTAHIQYPEIEKETYVSVSTGSEVYLPATLSKTIITDILRKDMGYSGVVATDSMQMDAIKENFDSSDAAVMAINAGVDILLMPVSITCKNDIDKLGDYIEDIIDAVKNGKITEERITESVKRIISLKLDRNIIDEDDISADQRVNEALKTVGSEENHEKEMKIAQKAVTLVKNDDNLLPLSTEDSNNVSIFIPYSDEENSIEFALQRLSSKFPDGMKAKVNTHCYRNSSVSDYEDNIKDSSVVVVFSETYRKTYLDKTSSDGWQAVFIDDLIELAHSEGKKVVLISSRLPYDIARYSDADAILLCYNSSGMESIPTEYNGETDTYGVNIPAAVCVMFGESAPKGKLPVDIYTIDENMNYTDTVKYPIGTGLTYLGYYNY